MIYTIAENLATLFEIITTFWFLIKIFGFRSFNNIIKILGTILFIVIQTITINIFNNHFVFEGVLSFINMAIYLIFSAIMLKQNLLYKVLAVVSSFLCLFMVAVITSTIGSVITGNNIENIITMHNSVRILLLSFNKVLYILVLIAILNFVKHKKLNNTLLQIITMIVLLLISFIIGLIVISMQMTNNNFIKNEIIIFSLLIFMIIFSFIMIFLINYQNILKSKNKLLEMQLQNQKNHINQLKEWDKNIKSLKHDLNNHLICIKEFISQNNSREALNYINKLSEAIEVIPEHFHTDNLAINAILNKTELICKKNNIDFKCTILTPIPKLDDIDICIVLSNILDNAVEASLKEDKPYIQLNMSIYKSYFQIIVTNKISKSILQTNSRLQTTKVNKLYHGIGLNNVKGIVDKYNGFLTFKEKNFSFITTVLLKYQS